MKKTNLLAILILAAAIVTAQRGADIVGEIMKGGQTPVIAIPDFRGSGDAQRFMNPFNETLWNDVNQANVYKLVPKSMYPLAVPQQPGDFQPQTMASWSGAPVNANYLAFGYTGIQGDQLILFGWMYDVTASDPSKAQILGKRYLGTKDENGARKVAHEFAADIVALLGGKTLAGSRIFFVSKRSGEKQVWSMDFDGANQKAFAPYPRDLCTMPSVAPDNSKIAFTRFSPTGPQILIHSLETGKRLPFVNPGASMNATLDFSPDGQHVVFSSTLTGFAQIYVSNIDGGGLRRVSSSRAVEMEPKFNPKNPNEIVCTSGRSGRPQIYKMNLDGADVERLTDGEGEASNAAWHPNGKHIAFAWTRGYEPGNWNIFIMDVSTKQYVQLTNGIGRNENPTWAPDGRHLVFSSNRQGGQMQIWSMLADGTGARPLTTQGRNEMPVWSKQ